MSIISDLKRHEGFRSMPYKDTEGHLTIGYGLNLDAGITEAEASSLLLSRVLGVQGILSNTFPWWHKLTPARQNVLVNMAYNLGVPGLLKFKNTLALIGQGRYEDAGAAMKASKWAGQVKGRADELIQTMITGE